MVAVLVLAGMTSIAACGPVNAGDDAAAEYREWVLDVDGVEDAEVTGSNALPFSAQVGATVTLEDELTENEVEDVIAELDTFDFTRAGRDLSVRIWYRGKIQIPAPAE